MGSIRGAVVTVNPRRTIVTFLMVFLIQNTQNREGQALQLKLDELLRATPGAHTALLDLEKLTDRELNEIQQRYTELARRGRRSLRSGGEDTGTPEVKFDTFAAKPKQKGVA